MRDGLKAVVMTRFCVMDDKGWLEGVMPRLPDRSLNGKERGLRMRLRVGANVGLWDRPGEREKQDYQGGYMYVIL